MRKEVDMECITPSNPIPIPAGETQDIFQTVKLNFNDNFFKDIYCKELPSILKLSKEIKCGDKWERKSDALESVSLSFLSDQLSNSEEDIRSRRNRNTLKSNDESVQISHPYFADFLTSSEPIKKKYQKGTNRKPKGTFKQV
jgi:hypothetical protein